MRSLCKHFCAGRCRLERGQEICCKPPHNFGTANRAVQAHITFCVRLPCGIVVPRHHYGLHFFCFCIPLRLASVFVGTCPRSQQRDHEQQAASKTSNRKGVRRGEGKGARGCLRHLLGCHLHQSHSGRHGITASVDANNRTRSYIGRCALLLLTENCIAHCWREEIYARTPPSLSHRSSTEDSAPTIHG